MRLVSLITNTVHLAGKQIDTVLRGAGHGIAGRFHSMFYSMLNEQGLVVWHLDFGGLARSLRSR